MDEREKCEKLYPADLCGGIPIEGLGAGCGMELSPDEKAEDRPYHAEWPECFLP